MEYHLPGEMKERHAEEHSQSISFKLQAVCQVLGCARPGREAEIVFPGVGVFSVKSVTRGGEQGTVCLNSKHL